MVRSEYYWEPLRKRVFFAMSKFDTSIHFVRFLCKVNERIKCDLSESKDRPGILQKLQFIFQICSAGVDFLSRGFVVWRYTSNRSGHVAVSVLQSIVFIFGSGLVCKPRFIEMLQEKFRASIPREDAARPISR